MQAVRLQSWRLPTQREKRNRYIAHTHTHTPLSLLLQSVKMRVTVLSGRWCCTAGSRRLKREEEKEERGESGGILWRDLGGDLLRCSLMTSGMLRAPSALEEAQCIGYRAQASNLILDHCNKIDTIYAILNSLICHRNPQRN